MIAKVILFIFALACIVIEASAGQQDVAKRSMFEKVHRWFIFEGKSNIETLYLRIWGLASKHGEAD